MVSFVFDIPNPSQQYIHVQLSFEVRDDITVLKLPAWRPGRYELGNFAKNLRSFQVYDLEGNNVDCQKVSKDSWAALTKGLDAIKVTYHYYASELNAGSTYLDKNQLYVNPVNCCIFTDDHFNDDISVKLNIPDYWDVACSMKNEGNTLFAKGFDELLDSPFIASGDLQRRSYDSDGVNFHVWFNGEVKPDWDRLLKDFKAFTDCQMAKFMEFPVEEYHFLNQILPYKAYHGVEHQRSTVIALGPSYDVFGDLYKELLGVSSHELYHTWNVKAIRPIEMYPYDFTKENYSKLGYICEGVTTYMGDLFLLKSGVFKLEEYFNEMNKQLQRHFDNPARFYTSVAESSFDTWLDGYVSGAPGRKVSIYTEGCLISFVIDVRILKATGNKYGLDEVMKRLYFNYALESKGVGEADYKQVIEEVSGEDFTEFFAAYINGNAPFESILMEAFEYLGLEMIQKASDSYSEASLGIKAVRGGNHFVVKALYPGGSGEMAGLMIEDEITAINGFACNGELDKWLNYFDDDTKILTIKRNETTFEVVIPEVARPFYTKYAVRKLESTSKQQEKALKAWMS